MKTGETITLPAALPGYSPLNEQTNRRTIETTFRSLRSDIVIHRDMKDKVASLAQRRFQFLLMGA